MGVPSFFRWLVNKYPKVIVDAIGEGGDPHSWPPANRNGVEFDNLYLDMNGIIHPCFHPDDQISPPRTFDEVFLAIFAYIDRLFCFVRPRNLLYLAIDGVAPRAKLNQQRARRYKTAKDAMIFEEEEQRLRTQFEREGRELLPKVDSELADSNIITPGTVFMDRLSKALEYYIRLRINTHPGWKNLKVILSNSNVPGEGEHKIMSFIRLQRGLSGYNPNTRHCLYGLDADLIMLALATHEIHFSILREDVLSQNTEEISLSSVKASLTISESTQFKCRQWFKHAATKNNENQKLKLYQFLNIWTLREYLELEFRIPDAEVPVDIERIIDDFVFVSFFAGNDFLPNLPSIEIHEAALDLLIHVYKSEFKSMGGYIIDTTRLKEKNASYVKTKRLQRYIHALGNYEQRIFDKRCNLRERKQRRLQREREDSECDLDNFANSVDQIHLGNQAGSFIPSQTLKSKPVLTSQSTVFNSSLSVDVDKSEVLMKNTRDMFQTLKSFLREKGDLLKNGNVETDRVKFDTPGWESRYYRIKFSTETTEAIDNIKKDLVERYTEGLLWVLQYYFSGVCSWNWFFPFHYAPFASSFKRVSCSTVKFNYGEPFKPFDQLMAVLPPRSAHALPQNYEKLMISGDSPIVRFYPSDFDVDVDGKRFVWQAIAKLPFIEEGPLLSETLKLGKDLQEEERGRNEVHSDKIFVSVSSGLGLQIKSLSDRSRSLHGNTKSKVKTVINNVTSGGFNGFLSSCDGELGEFSYGYMVKNGLEQIEDDDQVLCAVYENPEFHEHVPRPLENVEMPSKSVNENDLEERGLWHEYHGYRPPNTTRYNKFQNQQRSPQGSESPMGSFLGKNIASKGPSCSGRGFFPGAGRGRASSSICGAPYHEPYEARRTVESPGEVDTYCHPGRRQRNTMVEESYGVHSSPPSAGRADHIWSDRGRGRGVCPWRRPGGQGPSMDSRWSSATPEYSARGRGGREITMGARNSQGRWVVSWGRGRGEKHTS